MRTEPIEYRGCSIHFYEEDYGWEVIIDGLGQDTHWTRLPSYLKAYAFAVEYIDLIKKFYAPR
jgi:hypothetical protein